MPRIFDNIELSLLPTLRETLKVSYCADFCVGYFNLRGWQKIDDLIEQYIGGEKACCRLLIGMQSLPEDEVRTTLTLGNGIQRIDNKAIIQFKKRIAAEFRQQLIIGVPTNQDEAGLRRLSIQIKAKKLQIKLFLRHPLHAKLYLIHRNDPNTPTVGFLGSSNLTLPGLAKQGELNVDVLDHDACNKLHKWFEDRWEDFGCVDISKELAELIDESWAREELIPPYYIYLKIAYHLSHEAIAGLSEFRIPSEFKDRLFEFQKAAVQLAARHVTKRGGVLVGDVVGLGKTLVGTALAKILQEDCLLETLIICPKNLVDMWQGYVEQYRLIAKVLSISKVLKELPNLRRYRVVLIDESHNLRNREGKCYRAIQEYITANESRCILLSATPYNKTYLDLSAQLRLFVPEDQDLGFRPEQLLNQLGGGTAGELEFIRRHQCSVRSLAAFEKSESPDDWRDLMKRYMVRRTRSFIQENYAETDDAGRKYLTFSNGGRSYFPERLPKTIRFSLGDSGSDLYSRLYSESVVDAIDNLHLPRYGLGNYVAPLHVQPPTEAERRQLNGLSRAGRRLMGFCRTNLFKRLESSGIAFIQSLERHILRNFIYLYAIENGLDIPIGSQEADLLDTRISDEDSDSIAATLFDTEIEDDDEAILTPEALLLQLEDGFRQQAGAVYAEYASRYKRRFKWLRPILFDIEALQQDLLADARLLLGILRTCGRWNPHQDEKLIALVKLLQQSHPKDKVLIFTQFADTVRYLVDNLEARNITSVAGITGQSSNPTEIVGRFSPVSNEKRDRVSPADELRILIATDILSEGHNLQDCATIVNFDLPWAIIRLIQRAGRVDRIGQKAEKILCYSFLPAEGVERIINLRGRLRRRLRENAEVVGTDEAFFEDDDAQVILDLYNERSGILDGEDDTEVDLTSEAFQIWKNATEANPALKKTIGEMPSVVYSTRAYTPTPPAPEGVLLYMKTAEGNDSLIWVDRNGNSVTQSQLAILKAAACDPDTPAIARDDRHHELVKKGAELIAQEEKNAGGQLGRPTGARFRTYDRLKHYARQMEGTLFVTEELLRAIDEIYRYPLRQSATDTLNRQLKSGISDQQLAELVVALRADDRLSIVSDEAEQREPEIICSLGLFEPKGV
ncbi:helicase-related protein [Scytonema millei]|uniref:NgoFVII family restriction endonuclease n=1 Tax=Scytonema millei VB511283 TaxID=1245923 RepID=A0A9X5E7T7_9CYAN|nr:helicase-related protein [Scytonema millei]NHC36910.1 NgoFVII family restriction endonuclease [Scytonema millei VB511283]